MAGYMYLGNKKVCPAVLVGSSPEPEITEFFTFKFPDNMVNPPNQGYYLQLMIVNQAGTGYENICVDFNKVKTFNGSFSASQYGFEYVPLVPKVENIEKIFNHGLTRFGYFCLAVEGHKDINFENLTEIGGYGVSEAFYNDEEKTFDNIRFQKLSKINSSAFGYFGNTGVDIYFNALTSSSFVSTSALDYIGVGDNKTLHFPSNLSSVIPTLSGYPNFGGSNTTILYDLEDTE